MKITLRQIYDHIRKEVENELDASYFGHDKEKANKYFISSRICCYVCGNKQSNSKIYFLDDRHEKFFLKCRKCNTFFHIPEKIKFKKATASQQQDLLIQELSKK